LWPSTFGVVSTFLGVQLAGTTRIALASIATTVSVLAHGTPAAALDPDVEASRAKLGPQVDSDAQGDGIYGRLAGDFDVSVRLGGEYERSVAPTVGASLFYFWTLGISADHVFDTAKSIQRTSLGVELRPLFLPRWDADLQRGPALLDLTLDSLAIGAAVHLPHESGADPGPQLSLGLGLPLLARASGPWLEFKGVYRFPSEPANGAAAFALLSWHALFDSGLHADR
jgi:hypothetical protein